MSVINKAAEGTYPSNDAAEGTNPSTEDTGTEDQPQQGLGDGGIKALKTEREARAAAEKALKEAEAKILEFKQAEMTEVERAKQEAEKAKAEASTLQTQLARATALAKYPVPEEYQDLVVGTDAESFEAAAKKLHELHVKAENVDSGKKELFDHALSKTGNSAPVSEGSYEAGAEKARQKYNKQK